MNKNVPISKKTFNSICIFVIVSHLFEFSRLHKDKEPLKIFISTQNMYLFMYKFDK